MSQELLAKYGLSAVLPQHFDHSFTGTFRECQRMAWLGRILGRQTRHDKWALVWGKVFHKLAELYTNGENVEVILETIEANIPDVVEDRYGRDRARMAELFMEWVRYRRLNPIETIRTEQQAVVACLEGPCPYTEHGCGLIYGGKLDNIVRWNNLIGPLDFKTTVMTEDDPIAQFRPGHQMEGYVWMTSHLLNKRCWGAIIERLICNKSKIEINRYPVPFTKDQIIEWMEQEQDMHAEIRSKDLYAERQWAQNYGRCYEPYPCNYRDVCLSPREGDFRLRWLRDNTIEERFDFTKVEEGTVV